MKGGSTAKNTGISLLLMLSLDLGQAMAASGQPQAGMTETASLIGAIFKVLGSLAVVIALMVGLVYLLKKAGLNQGMRGSSIIKVLDTQMVAPKKYITIVEIGGKTVSLGITDQNITMLTELDHEQVHAELKSQNKPATGQVNNFADLLAKASKWRKKTPTHPSQEVQKNG